VIQNNKKHTVRVSRLKQAYDSKAWKHKAEGKSARKLRKKPNLRSEEEQENENKFGSYPLSEASQPELQTEHQVPPDQAPINPEAVPQITDTPTSEYQDPTFRLPQTPKSRREMQTTMIEPPFTRSRARIMSRDNATGSTNAEK